MPRRKTKKGAPTTPKTTTAIGLPEFTAAVSSLLLQKWGLNWADACGDAEPLAQAHADGISPDDFAQGWGERYDLTPMAEVGL